MTKKPEKFHDMVEKSFKYKQLLTSLEVHKNQSPFEKSTSSFDVINLLFDGRDRKVFVASCCRFLTIWYIIRQTEKFVLLNIIPGKEFLALILS